MHNRDHHGTKAAINYSDKKIMLPFQFKSHAFSGVLFSFYFVNFMTFLSRQRKPFHGTDNLGETKKNGFLIDGSASASDTAVWPDNHQNVFPLPFNWTILGCSVPLSKFYHGEGWQRIKDNVPLLAFVVLWYRPIAYWCWACDFLILLQSILLIHCWQNTAELHGAIGIPEPTKDFLHKTW